MEKFKVDEVVIVEGKYDKNHLSQILDANILQTDGFGIFSQKDKLKLIKKLAEERGIVILTDSDSAGFMIRNYIKGCIPSDKIKHAYIPDIFGKEKRKRSPSAENKLGVEGISPDIIIQALKNAGVCQGGCRKGEITKADMFEAGLTGQKNSSQKRLLLIKKLDLPERLTADALLEILNILYTKEEYNSLVENLNL